MLEFYLMGVPPPPTPTLKFWKIHLVRTFVLVSAHPYCARKFTRHLMHTRALSYKMIPYFSPQKHILFTIISTLSKSEQKKNQCEKLKKIKISVQGASNQSCSGLKARETVVAKCENCNIVGFKDTGLIR